MTDDANTADLPNIGSSETDAERMQAEAEFPMLRGMRLSAEATARRWKSYGLPEVTPLASFADYAAEAAKRAEIAVARSQIEAELNAANKAIALGFAALRDDETERQARDILDGKPDEAFAGFEMLKAQVSRLTQRLTAYARAVGMQDEKVATIRSDRSIDAAEAMAPTHRAAVADIAAACLALRVALDREEAIRAAVTSAGFDARLPSFASPRIIGQNGPLDELEQRASRYAE